MYLSSMIYHFTPVKMLFEKQHFGYSEANSEKSEDKMIKPDIRSEKIQILALLTCSRIESRI